ncbi:MAG: hypothetical protein Q4E41_00340 [Bacteroidales bacterium]|nr:hypothetical protein [Bacteroidales bacterium]
MIRHEDYEPLVSEVATTSESTLSALVSTPLPQSRSRTPAA